MMYRSDSTEIKQALKIEEVIEFYTGEKFRNSRIKCPFHSEKTASFFVNKKKQYYKCFGCGEGGDILTFVQKYFALSFAGAIEKLCCDFGINITEKTEAEIIHENEALRQKKAFEAWKNEAFAMLCDAYHEAMEFIKKNNTIFIFDRVTDTYLYVINRIDLLGLYIDLLIENPVEFYGLYREEAVKIAGSIIAGCRGGQDKPNDL